MRSLAAFAGALVMLLGLAFLSVVTAAITSSFVARATEQRARRADSHAPAPGPDHVTSNIEERLDRMEALLRRDDIVERLDRMEALLRDRS